MQSMQYTETKYLLTVQETSRILGVSIHTVYRLIEAGKLSAIKISSRKTIIKVDEIQRYISEK